MELRFLQNVEDRQMFKAVWLFVLTVLIVTTALATQQRTRVPYQPPPSTDPAAVVLVRDCESTRDYFALCAGTLSGIQLGIDATQSRTEKQEICFPMHIVPLNDLREIFMKYVQRHPDKLDAHNGHVAYAAFLEAYPCKK
jgi:hypothetical protein